MVGDELVHRSEPVWIAATAQRVIQLAQLIKRPAQRAQIQLLVAEALPD